MVGNVKEYSNSELSTTQDADTPLSTFNSKFDLTEYDYENIEVFPYKAERICTDYFIFGQLEI